MTRRPWRLDAGNIGDLRPRFFGTFDKAAEAGARVLFRDDKCDVLKVSEIDGWTDLKVEEIREWRDGLIRFYLVFGGRHTDEQKTVFKAAYGRCVAEARKV